MQTVISNNVVETPPKRVFKLTILCTEGSPTSGTHKIVGFRYSPAWFNVLKYFLSTKLGAEGLQVIKTEVEEITS